MLVHSLGEIFHTWRSGRLPWCLAAVVVTANFSSGPRCLRRIPDLLYLRVQRKRSRKKVTFDPERIQFADSVEKFWELVIFLESFKLALFKRN